MEGYEESMADKKSKNTQLDRAARQRRVYSIVIIVLSVVVVLSMVLSMLK
jgi:t-SNARE complex subunit (syntaxin)